MPTSGKKQEFSSKEQYKVKLVKLNVLSKEEILAMSVCQVTSIRTYDYNLQLPADGGLNDRRMGVCDGKLKCLTCEGTDKECPGHFGHIELAKPVYHVGFLDIVQKILTCVCQNCSKLLLPDNVREFEKIKNIKKPQLRLREVYSYCQKHRQCAVPGEDEQQNAEDKVNLGLDKIQIGCGFYNPTYSKQGIAIKIKPKLNNEEETQGTQEREFFAEEALAIFNKIRPEDIALIGLDPVKNRPENYIIQVLPVPPPQVRPSVQMDAVFKSEDDLTHQYVAILKNNQSIQQNIQNNMPPQQNQKFVQLLNWQVATLFNNDLPGQPQAKTKKGKKPIKSYYERLKGKEGRIRKNLMGKRVDFSARTVVSPDPNLYVDELGIPRSMALNLTFPEVVTPLNIDRLKKLVVNGPTEWPGAKTITNDVGVFDLRYCVNREDIQLNYGNIVQRHIVDGDYVVFNRQPTLHRMSMMGHRIRILPYSSFRLNLSVTTPYNADFDGDEMNMHVPQNFETKAEIKNIMHVPKQIVSSQANKPVMGLVQDVLCGIKIFTKRDTFLNQAQVMNLLLWIDNWNGELPTPAILRPEKLWTGKQIISLIIPEINMEQVSMFAKSDSTKGRDPEVDYSLKDGKVLIDKGEILSGQLDKSTVGSTGGGIVHVIWLDYGCDAAAIFLANAQKIINNWLSIYGFSVGVSDIFPDQKVSEAVAVKLLDTEKVVPELFTQAQKKKMDHQPGKSMLASFEYHVNLKLNNIFNESCKIAQAEMNDNNNIYNMVCAGSKGSNLNIAQIMVCVGQQNVEGNRIPYGFYRRTLPHYCKDDYNPESRGFVVNSYLTGLTPQEFFFHAMGGREGLIDTACKTSETGYLQRRLIKALEDVMVKYDGTVRDSSGNIIQFLYGEDGMAGEYIESIVTNFILTNNQNMINDFRWFNPTDERDIQDQLQEYENHFDQSVISEMIDKSSETFKILQEEFESMQLYRNKLRKIFPNFDNKYYLPVNFNRLIKSIKKKYKVKHQYGEDKKCFLNPVEVVREVDEQIKKLVISKGNDMISKEMQQNGIYLLKIMIKFYLNSKQVCIKQKFTKEMFYEIIGEIEQKFMKAQVHPGEMIGVICGQSLGEPTTQMTLNTFHYAGHSAHNVTLGVPRIKEILSCTKNIKTPSMKIYIKPGLAQNLEQSQAIAKSIQAELEYSSMQHITKSTQLYYDPIPDDTIIVEDQKLLSEYLIMADEEENTQFSSWVLRFQLDRLALMDRKLEDFKVIRHQIKSTLKNVQVITTQEAIAQNPVIRLRLIDIADQPSDEQFKVLKEYEKFLLQNLRLKGIPEIKRVFMKKIDVKVENYTDGEIKTQKDNEYLLETDGSNLKVVINYDQIDHRRITTNNNIEIFEVLGIEAARISLIKEIRFILDAYGIYVNYRHLTTLCDIMTQRGNVNSISRHGINKALDGPLRRCSFEQTVEILLQAGVFSESQNFYGISENLMFGQLCPIGTGSFDLILNKKVLSDAKYIPDQHIYQDLDAITGPNSNQMELEEEFPQGHETPKYISGNLTPVYDLNNAQQTPNQAYKTPMQGAFTPLQQQFNQGISPVYGVQEFGGAQQSPGMMSPQPFVGQTRNYAQILSPSYQISSLGYSPNQHSVSSSKYSPHQSSNVLQYSPTSPTYHSTSVSPSYSSSQKAYSPNSPSYSYSVNSPTYHQNNSLSPASPQYSGTTPQSQNSPISTSVHQSNQIYSPNSPAYQNPQVTSGYVQQSPAYDNTQKNQENIIKEDYSENEESDEEQEDK